MTWTRIADDVSLPEGIGPVFTVAGHQVLLVRHRGEVFAVESRCPHMGRNLKDGRLTDDGHIVCALHHSEFDLRSGEVLAWAPWPPVVSAVLGAIRQKRALVVYPTRVSEGAIWVGTE